MNRTVVWGALCLVMTVAMAGSALAQDMKFTQCLREKASPPCEQWKVNQEYCRASTAKLFLDEARGCYGQRWSIPKGFYQLKYVAYKPVTEALILTVGRPGIVAGISSLTPGRDLPKQVPSLHKEVKVRPLFTSSFEQRVAHTVKSSASTGGLADTTRQIHGLRIFDQLKAQPKQYRDAFLFPARGEQWYARCVIKPGLSVEEDLKTPGGCTVVHNIDDR